MVYCLTISKASNVFEVVTGSGVDLMSLKAFPEFQMKQHSAVTTTDSAFAAAAAVAATAAAATAYVVATGSYSDTDNHRY